MDTTMARRFLWLLALVPLIAGAGEKDDSGMVTLVQGNAVYSNAQEKAKPIVAFMKVRVGDRLVLSKDAKVQVAYFESGRQETWRGEARVDVGTTESKADKTAPAPEVKQLSPAVLQRLSKAPAILSDIKSRVGMVTVRALMASEDAAHELDENYATMRGQAAPEDVTPELYLLAGLYDMRRYREMSGPLEEMRRRQPDNPEIAVIAEHYTKIMERKRAK